ncbi:hypothetical protein ACFFKE_32145 [Streptomyces mutabilis]|uniref:hypothetical protein n=1 Tax=Streptomyces mutabilis TaxID=67332 RepID=UPI0017867D00|nr:hypothetical protein [Streptomyces mutabilis]GGQ38269.1 hypothetical protein GCM10010279_54380 [Streptomyces mutabilis]
MADGEITGSRIEPSDAGVSASGGSEPGDVQIDVELRDGLPGGRAFIAVEQDGLVTWLADKNKVPEQAVGDLLAEMRSMVRQRGWVQNWSGAS